MSVERWSREVHGLLLEQWANERLWPAFAFAFLPRFGFVVDGIVAGFLYRTDSAVCYLDSFISDPKSDRDARRAALDLLIDALKAEAKELKFTAIVAPPSSNLTDLIARAERHGFRKVNDCTYMIGGV